MDREGTFFSRRAGLHIPSLTLSSSNYLTLDRIEYLNKPGDLIKAHFNNTQTSTVFDFFLDPKNVPFQQPTAWIGKGRTHAIDDHNAEFVRICTNFLGKCAATESEYLQIPSENINLVVNDKACKDWVCYWLPKINTSMFLTALEGGHNTHMFLWFWLKVNILISTVVKSLDSGDASEFTCNESFSFVASYLLSLFPVMGRIEAEFSESPTNVIAASEIVQKWVDHEMCPLDSLERMFYVANRKVCGISYKEHYTFHTVKGRSEFSGRNEIVTERIKTWVGDANFSRIMSDPISHSLTLNCLTKIFSLHSKENSEVLSADHVKLWKSMHRLAYLVQHNYPSNDWMERDRKHFVNHWYCENISQSDLPDLGSTLLSCNLTKNTNGCASKNSDIFSKILSTAFPHHCQIRAISDIIQEHYDISHTSTKLPFKTQQDLIEHLDQMNETATKLTDFVNKMVICSVMCLYETDSGNYKDIFWTGDDVGIKKMLDFHRMFILDRKARKTFVYRLCKNKDVIRTIVQEYLLCIIRDYEAFKDYLTSSIDWIDHTAEQTTQCTAGVFKIALTYPNFEFSVAQNSNVLRSYFHMEGKIPGESKDPNKRNVHYDQVWYNFMKNNRWYNTTLQRKSYWFDESLFKCLNKVYRSYFTIDMFFTGKATTIIDQLNDRSLELVREYCELTRSGLIQNDEELNWVKVLSQCGMCESDGQVCQSIFKLYIEKQSDGKIINDLWKLTRTGFNLLFNLVLHKLNTGFINFIDVDIDTVRGNADALMANKSLGFPFMNTRICYTSCCKRMCNYTVPNSYGYIDVAMKLCSKNSFECIKHKKHGTWERKNEQYIHFEENLKQRSHNHMKTSIDKPTRLYLRQQYRYSMGDIVKRSGGRNTKLKNVPNLFNPVDPSWFSMWSVPNTEPVLKVGTRKRNRSVSVNNLEKAAFVSEFTRILPKDIKTFTNKQAKRFYGLKVVRELERNTKVNMVDITNKLCMYRFKKKNDFVNFRSCQRCCLISPSDDNGWMGGKYFCQYCINGMK